MFWFVDIIPERAAALYSSVHAIIADNLIFHYGIAGQSSLHWCTIFLFWADSLPLLSAFLSLTIYTYLFYLSLVVAQYFFIWWRRRPWRAVVVDSTAALGATASVKHGTLWWELGIQETRNAGPLSSADTTTKETTARLEIRLAREAIWETVSRLSHHSRQIHSSLCVTVLLFCTERRELKIECNYRKWWLSIKLNLIDFWGNKRTQLFVTEIDKTERV